MTGLSRSMISKFERGQTDIQLSSMIQIFSAVSLTLAGLCHERLFDEFLMNCAKQLIDFKMTKSCYSKF